MATATNSTNHDTHFVDKEYCGRSIIFAVPTSSGAKTTAWFVQSMKRQKSRRKYSSYHPDEIGNRFLTFAIDSRTSLKLFFLNLVSIATDRTLHSA